MNNMKAVLYFMSILVFLAIHCNGFLGKGSKKPSNERGCAVLGEVCSSSWDCCGHDDPETGHCVICTSILYHLFDIGHKTCGCSQYSVAVDPSTHEIVTDVCDGRARSGDSICRTRLAAPGENYYRGDEYYRSRKQ